MAKFQSISILGCGNMGGSLLKGIVSSKKWSPSKIFIYDANTELVEQWVNLLGVNRCDSVEALAESSPNCVAAVKPQIFPTLDLEPLQKHIRVLISIMAGLSIEKIKALVGQETSVVRTMPNLPLSVNQGMTAIATDHLSENVIEGTEEIFAAVGSSVRVSEKQMDAVTGVSGSGPMYVFEFVEGLITAGIGEGLTPAVSKQLALQTVKGAVALLENGDDTPSAWTKKVCSPGGTTLAALAKLEAADFKGVVKAAVQAATARSRELGQ